MNRWLTFFLFVVALGLNFVFGLLWRNSCTRLVGWLLVAVGVVLLVMLLSKSTISLRRLLIDERNRYSQPMLITIVWFVIVVSAYLACALWNVALWTPSSRSPLPVEITVPAAVWVLAGIIGVDFILSRVILNEKRKRTPSTRQLNEAKQSNWNHDGVLFLRNLPTDAEAGDLVNYDELSYQDSPDLAAIHKLLFQIAAVVVYAVALGRLIFLTDPATSISAFPSIPEGFLALLGVSTGVALANRNIPRA